MTLLERFKAYLSSQFKLVPPGREAAELREEMLGNLMSHAMELKAEGIPDDEVYTRCIEALGDYTEAINALRGKPLQVVRDPKFQRSVLLLVTFSLLCVTAYILMGILGDLWAVGAYTIFPAMAIAMYVFATASVLKRNIRFSAYGVVFRTVACMQGKSCGGVGELRIYSGMGAFVGDIHDDVFPQAQGMAHNLDCPRYDDERGGFSDRRRRDRHVASSLDNSGGGRARLRIRFRFCP